ncbi:MAG TPA: hypothetical protein VFV66_07625 [Nonomuraea sp.]|nr:hypothetical protein [Nonomuraea sp.]
MRHAPDRLTPPPESRPAAVERLVDGCVRRFLRGGSGRRSQPRLAEAAARKGASGFAHTARVLNRQLTGGAEV